MFGGLTAIVFLTGHDFSYLRTILMLCGLGSLVMVGWAVFSGHNLGVPFSVMTIILCCGYILYDTVERDETLSDRAACRRFAGIIRLRGLAVLVCAAAVDAIESPLICVERSHSAAESRRDYERAGETWVSPGSFRLGAEPAAALGFLGWV